MLRKITSALLLFSFVLTITACAPAAPASDPQSPTAQSANPQVAANELLVRIPDKPSPPFYYQDANGEWTGLEVEMTRALLLEAGFTPKFVGLPWSRALESMKSGEIHIMSNLSKTDERSAYIDWIGPERMSRMILAVKKENETLPIASLDDLIRVAKQKNIKFSIKQDTFYSAEFNDRLNDPAFAQWFETVSDELLNPGKVAKGRTLGWFQDEALVRYMITHNPDYAGLVVHSFALTESEVFFGVSKSGVGPDVLAKLQAAYKTLEKNGKFAIIRERNWE